MFAWTIFVVITALEVVIGALIGAGKNRTKQGIALALMLGLIGLVIINAMKARVKEVH